MLKNLTILGFSLMATTSYGSDEFDFDGCYQLYAPSTMYPGFCLAGTTEEGINGAGVRLVMFHTNTDDVAACMKSSASKMTSDSFVFESRGRAEMILKNVEIKSGSKQGDAVLGRTRLKFHEVSTKEIVQRLMNKMNDECQF